RVATRADDDRAGVGEVLIRIAERARFGGATRRVVGRIEVEDDPLAGVIGQPDRAVRGRQFELRSGITFREHGRSNPERGSRVPPQPLWVRCTTSTVNTTTSTVVVRTHADEVVSRL